MMTKIPSVRFVLDQLDHNASALPDAVAVSDGDMSLTWSGLRAAALSVAAALLDAPVEGRPVAVAAQRSAPTLAMFYGVLYAGGFYLALDPEMPAARVGQIRANSGFELALGCGERPGAIGPELWLDCTQSVCSPRAPGGAQLRELERRRAALSEESPLYLVYTSGSTGVPKGVLKQYGAMQSFVAAFLDEYPIAQEDVIGNQTPFFFDASAKDVYWSLFTGCRLEIIPTRLFSFPVQLLEYLRDAGVTVISWVPSALSIVAQLGALSCVVPSALRAVFFVGEIMPVKHLAAWRAALPDACFVNLYGSSEIAGVCCHFRIGDDLPAGEALPLGTPFAHCRLTLLGESGPVDRPGQEGELLVESPALAECYFHDEERTRATFVTRETPDGPARCLRTGDMAMYGQDGLLTFTSRRDFQIKHMGYRIELGEIETAAAALEGVGAAACIYDAQRSRIVLYVQPQPDVQLVPADISAQLRGRLCAYMLPQRVFALEQLPLNRNGKIDRPALRAIYDTTGVRRRARGKE